MVNWSVYDWWGFDLSKPSSLKKLIKTLEQLIRKSPEYKIWANKCRSNYDFCPKCGVEKYIDPLEVHHSTKTLYEIVEETIDKHIENNEEHFIKNISPIDIVKEILLLHLEDKVDYEILCSSCHERLHNERKLKQKNKEY